nr:cyclic nucleotide-binding domain-containing protein [Anaerolineae bacterium]
MDLVQLLRSVEIFAGLSDDQFEKLANTFEERELSQDEILFRQGDEGNSLCLIKEGFVEIIAESSDKQAKRTLVNLGPGQLVGEMALIDQGVRSASVRAANEGTVIATMSRQDFEKLCMENSDIGYVVMRNIAADLSFKLRHRKLSE